MSTSVSSPSSNSLLQQLSVFHRTLLKQVFAHYAGPSSMANGTGMCIASFRRLLRDAGLLQTPAGASGGLRRPCEGRPITAAQADVALVQAANGGAGSGGIGGEASEVQLAQRLPTAHAFARALEIVAQSCAPWPGNHGSLLAALCEEALVPVGAVLPPGREILDAAAIMSAPSVTSLLRSAKQGLLSIFTRFATKCGEPAPYQQGHLTIKGVSRFAAEANLVAEVSHSVLHRLFCECTAYESNTGPATSGKLTFSGFQVVLMAIAERVHQHMNEDPCHRLAVLFLRLSMMPVARELKGPARAALARETGEVALISEAPARPATTAQPAPRGSRR